MRDAVRKSLFELALSLGRKQRQRDLLKTEHKAQSLLHMLGELSSVYRYLLQANDQELTSLAMELNFIRSYYLPSVANAIWSGNQSGHYH